MKKAAKQVPDLKQLHGYITKNPGVRAEALREAFDIEPIPLGRMLRKLRDSKHVKAKGVTRAMVYTATAKALA